MSNTDSSKGIKHVTSTSLVGSPNYGSQSKWIKLKRKIRGYVLIFIHGTPLQFKLYKSYWHYVLTGTKQTESQKKRPDNHYLGQLPNYGAGIGHQLANWNSGLYFSKVFNLKFAHFPFSTAKWEDLLGFGEDEEAGLNLIKSHTEVVQLPRFNSDNLEEIDLIRKIIDSYKKPNILFRLEQDQGYMRQFETFEELSKKFFAAPSRRTDKRVTSENDFTIAIHIRRRMKIETEEVWKSRGLDNIYFADVLKQVLGVLRTDRKVRILLFSQGNEDDFPEFRQFDNVQYCMEMNAMDSFIEMAYADLLISSKSSFSYKPALISKGIKIYPKSFWHGYPSTPDFVPADNNGEFDHQRLASILNKLG